MIYRTLSNGAKMPALGLGTFQSKPDEVKVAVGSALDAGYRHIDTAYFYRNEEAIGEVLSEYLKSGKVKREELFIVTKLPTMAHRPEHVVPTLKDQLKALQLDYVDCYLIHFPVAVKMTPEKTMIPVDKDGRVMFEHVLVEDTWKGMEACVDAGLARGIGVSNFNKSQLERLAKVAKQPIVHLQVECHPCFMQNELFDYCKQNKIELVAFAPLGSPNRLGQRADEPTVMEQPIVKEMAEKYKKTPAQICLRFLLQTGRSVIPKSVTPSRIAQNFDVFDFELQQDDVQRLCTVDCGKRLFKMAGGATDQQPEYPF